MSVFVTLRVYHDFLGSFTVRRVYPKSGIGVDNVSADRAATMLLSKDAYQLFTSFGAVQHLFPFAFLEIIRPFSIKWI